MKDSKTTYTSNNKKPVERNTKNIVYKWQSDIVNKFEERNKKE